MKKIVFLITSMLFLVTNLSAKDSDYMDKIVKLWTLKTNKVIEFNTTKVDDGYNLIISSKNPYYKELFSTKPIKIRVDEGPIITTPHFTLGTAGLMATGSILDILNPKIVKDIKTKVKHIPKYKYEATVSFGNEYESEFEVEPFAIKDKDIEVEISKITSKSDYDLDTFTGKESIKIDKVLVEPKKEEGKLSLKDIDIKTESLQEPIDDIMLFMKSNFSIKEVILNFKERGKSINTKFSASFRGNSIRVDRELLDFDMGYDFKALDEKTIALAKGIKESSLDLALKKLGINGVVEFIKLSKELEEANNNLIEATQKGDDAAMQKAILATQDISNKIVPIWNKTLIANKSKIILDLELKSDKTSYVKLDLTYKGKPLSGNVQSAMISLMAQQLGIFDGKFDIAVDSTLATSINPFALMGLDLLKAKGFVDVKNGVYYLKGELKGGKIIIKGKAYTLPELTKALF